MIVCTFYVKRCLCAEVRFLFLARILIKLRLLDLENLDQVLFILSKPLEPCLFLVIVLHHTLSIVAPGRILSDRQLIIDLNKPTVHSC